MNYDALMGRFLMMGMFAGATYSIGVCVEFFSSSTIKCMVYYKEWDLFVVALEFLIEEENNFVRIEC